MNLKLYKHGLEEDVIHPRSGEGFAQPVIVVLGTRLIRIRLMNLSIFAEGSARCLTPLFYIQNTLIAQISVRLLDK